MNPYYIELLLREKRHEILREAERLRMLAQYQAATPPKTAKMLANLGELLIRMGEKLKNRYGMQTHSLAVQHPCKDC